MEKRKQSCKMPKPISACSTLPHRPMRLRESGKASKTQRRVVCVRRVKLWKCSVATTRYLVRLTDRALRDMHAIYAFIEAEGSETRLHGSTIWPARPTVYSDFPSADQPCGKARNCAICLLAIC